jgi:Putative translation initiation inhibitor, yjgF family
MPKAAFGPPVTTPLSMGIRHGNLLFISGQVPIDFDSGAPPPEGIEAQTTMVLETIRDLLAEHGADLSHVVKTTVFLTNIDRDFRAMNEVYRTFFPDPKPARSTFEVKLAVDVTIEVEAIAILDD